MKAAVDILVDSDFFKQWKRETSAEYEKRIRLIFDECKRGRINTFEKMPH